MPDKQVLHLSDVPASTFQSRKPSGKALSPGSPPATCTASPSDGGRRSLDRGRQAGRQALALQSEGRGGWRNVAGVRVDARGQRLRPQVSGAHGARNGQLSRSATFRIAKAKYRGDTTRGVGAYRAHGRWNHPRRHAVYPSGHLALATLELLVHVDDASAFRTLWHVYHAATFPDDAVSVLAAQDLPSGWASRPVARASQVTGDEWLEAQSALVLAVPSVVVPTPHRYDPAYMYYVVNPEHPDFEWAVGVGAVLEFAFAPRLVEQRENSPG